MADIDILRMMIKRLDFIPLSPVNNDLLTTADSYFLYDGYILGINIYDKYLFEIPDEIFDFKNLECIILLYVATNS